MSEKCVLRKRKKLSLINSATSSSSDLLPCKIQRTYQCPKCDLVTRNPRDFLYHLRDEHGEKLKVYECKHCIYASRHPQKLQRHVGFIHRSKLNEEIKEDKDKDGKEMEKSEEPTLKRKRKGKRPASVSPDRVKIDEEQMSSSDDYGKNFEVEEFLPAKQQKIDLDDEEDEISNFEEIGIEENDTTTNSNSSLLLQNSTDFHQCRSCNFQSKSKMEITRHERVNHLKKKLFRCNKCGYVTHKRSRYTKHLRYHSLPCLKCENCDFKTPYKWNLDRHLKNHSVGAVYNCKMCSFAANTKQSLTVHVMNHHADGNDKNNFLASIGLVCQSESTIPVTTSTISNTQQEEEEDNEKKGEDVGDNSSCQNEIGVAEQNGGEAVNACEFYRKKGRWYRRMLSCIHCNFSTTSANELQEHEIQHKQEMADEGKVANEVPARQRLNLRARNLLRKVSKDVPSDSPRRGSGNNNSKPLKCKSCSYEAKWMSELVKHNRIHTQEKPFICTHCGFRSRWKGDMTRHIQKYHNEFSGNFYLDTSENPKAKKRMKKKESMEAKSWTSSPKREEEEDEVEDGNGGEFVEDTNQVGLNSADETKEELTLNDQVQNQRKSNSSSSLHVLRKCYRCPHCNFTASTASRFHVHIVAHLNQRPFMCSDCGYRSNWQWDVTKHIRLKSSHQESHTNASMVMVNEFAHRDYESYNKYIIYEDNPYTEDKRSFLSMKHSNQSEDGGKNRQSVWKCIQCAFKCFTKQGILFHLPTHSMDRPFFCGECGQSSKWRSVIETHCHTRHGNLTCIIENKKVVDALGGQIEPEENAYDDTNEQEGFIKEVVTDSPVVATKGNLIEEVQETQTSFVTTTKTTSKGDALKLHTCNMCPYQTKKMFDMKMHVRLHKPQPGAIFKCMFCPFYTSLRRSLLNHMKLHVNEPQEYIFKAMQTNNKQSNLPEEDDEDNDQDGDEEGEFDEEDPANVIGSESQLDDVGGEDELVIDEKREPIVQKSNPAPVTVGEGEAAMFVSVQMKRYSCDHCPYTSNSKTQYLYHKQFHRTTKMAPFKCPHCTYSVTKSHLLLQHLKLHKKPTDPPSGNKKVKEKEKVKESAKSSKAVVNSVPQMSMVIVNEEIVKTMNPTKKQAIPLVWVSKGGCLVKMFNCRFCPHVNKRRSNIREHEKMHRKRKVGTGRFSCPHCTYTCNNQGVLSSHVKVHQMENETSTSQVQSNQQIRVKEKVENLTDDSSTWTVPQKNGIFLCDLCPARFPRPSNAEVHRRFHGAPLAWKCTHCNYAARHRPHLHRHLKVHSLEYQNKLKKALESMSSTTITSKDGSTSSVTPKWETTKKHCCNLCPAAFLKVSSLAYHMSLHGGSGKFKCQYCDYAVRNCGNLVRHSKIHEVARPSDENNWSTNSSSPRQGEKRKLTCVKCPATFDKYSRYDVHLKLHGSNQRFTCKFCDYSVKFMANLLKHQRMHEECTPEEQQQQYQQLQQQQNLSDKMEPEDERVVRVGWSPRMDVDDHHSLVDMPVKLSLSEQQMLMLLQHQQQMVQQQRLGEDAKRLFYCDRCPYQHSRKDAVLSHLKRHRGSQEMTCSYCDYSTTLASFLREHTKLHFQPQKRQRIESYLKWEGMQVFMTNPSGENKTIFDEDDGNEGDVHEEGIGQQGLVCYSDEDQVGSGKNENMVELPLEVIVKTEVGGEEQHDENEEVGLNEISEENGKDIEEIESENCDDKMADVEDKEENVENDGIDEIKDKEEEICLGDVDEKCEGEQEITGSKENEEEVLEKDGDAIEDGVISSISDQNDVQCELEIGESVSIEDDPNESDIPKSVVVSLKAENEDKPEVVENSAVEIELTGVSGDKIL